MRSIAAARRYARALFSLALDDDRLGEVREELNTLCEILADSRELHDTLLTPLHPAAERKAVLRAVIRKAGLSTTLRNFCAFLVDQRRTVKLSAIRSEFDRLAEDASGRMTAEVVSASPLDAARKKRLRRVLSERTGRDVQLELRVDPELIGGAVAKVGDLIFDGSLRTQLAQLRASLSKS